MKIFDGIEGVHHSPNSVVVEGVVVVVEVVVVVVVDVVVAALVVASSDVELSAEVLSAAFAKV